MPEKRDYYDVLGVSKEVSPEELKKAYRKKAVAFHPDRNKDDPSAEDKFKEVGEAYEVLKDPEKRAAYDRFGHAAFSAGMGGGRQTAGGGFHDPFDIFREVFGSGSGRGGGGIFEEFFGQAGGGGRDNRGSDLRYDLEITLPEAVAGTEKEIRFRTQVACESCAGSGAEPGSRIVNCRTCGGRGRVIASSMGGFINVQQTCPTCAGAGQVPEKACSTCGGRGRIPKSRRINLRIPAGIDTGHRLRSSGNGEAGVHGGEPGDLHVFIHVKDHEIFERRGDDLFCEIPIKFTLAALGGSIEVPTLTGNSRRANLKIPAGTQNGTVFRLRERGVPNLRSGQPGDQLVRVFIEVPQKLSADQKDKLEAFAVACGDADNPVEKSFWDKVARLFD
jgi:molecular chaperone DnaJ